MPFTSCGKVLRVRPRTISVGCCWCVDIFSLWTAGNKILRAWSIPSTWLRPRHAHISGASVSSTSSTKIVGALIFANGKIMKAPCSYKSNHLVYSCLKWFSLSLLHMYCADMGLGCFGSTYPPTQVSRRKVRLLPRASALMMSPVGTAGRHALLCFHCYL